jgi:hypothetical protein
MYTFVKNTLIAFALSTSLVLADDKTTAMIDIDKVLPKMILSADVPQFSPYTRVRSTMYSPIQKAKIVELKLTGATEPATVHSVKEEKAMVYSPLQMASIVELKLTSATKAPSSLSKKEEKATVYSPKQRASIVELQLTAE